MSAGLTRSTDNYRPDVDGLRAVAVLLVMLYHAGFGWITGGFIGVDVFFVISGYVIARQSLELHSRGRFSAADFYARRARRILPPLLLMLIAVSIAAWFLLLPRDLVRFCDSLVASVAFSSNIFFWLQSGYFAPESDEQLLLHTWSLAVEEQFYLLWPIVVYFLGRLSPARARALVLGCLVSAFVAAAWAAFKAPSASFYLAPARAWEFMVGVLLALPGMPAVNRQSSGAVLRAVGLGLIAISSIVIDAKSSFPGIGALIPCAGAALVIYGGSVSPTSPTLLSRPIFVLIGQISFGLYLWHWPLFALHRYITLREPEWWEGVGLLLLTFLLATISWVWVERPVRSRVPLPALRWVILKHAVAAILLTLAGGLIIRHFGGSPLRVPAEIQILQEIARDYGPLRHCLREGGSLPGRDECKFGYPGGNPIWVMWGDSHASQAVAGIAPVLQKRGITAVQWTKGACAPLPGFHASDAPGAWPPCAQFNALAERELVTHAEIRTIVLSANWLALAKSDEHLDIAMAMLDQLLRRLASAGKRVLLVGQLPAFAQSPPDCLARRARLGLAISHCGQVSRHHGLGRTVDNVNARLSTLLARHPGVKLLEPTPHFCSRDSCSAKLDDEVAFMDEGHIGGAGAVKLFERMALGQWIDSDVPAARHRDGGDGVELRND